MSSNNSTIKNYMRVRNRILLDPLLNLNASNGSNGGTGYNPIGPLRKWKWGALGNRLGSEKSADGIVFDLPYVSAPDGKKVVAKFIFCDDYDCSLRAQREYDLTKLMGNSGLGPKVYGFYSVMNPASDGGRSFSEHIKNKSGDNINNFKLFRYNTNMNSFIAIYVLVMENLYNNKYLKAAYTVNDAVKKNFPVPFDKLRVAIDGMHKLGIVHGDMHGGNIMIQVIKKPLRPETFRVVIIDFGRSLKSNKPLNNNSANALGMANRTKKNSWWYSNNNSVTPVLLNSNAWKSLQRYNFKKKNGLKTRIAGVFKKK